MDSDFSSSCNVSQNATIFCPHIVQAIDLREIKKTIGSGLCSECPQCLIGAPNETIENVDDYHGVSLWLCLRCGNQACGRSKRKHALQHYKLRSDCHALCVNTTLWTVWCYDCDSMINPSSKKKLLETVEWLKKQPPITLEYHPVEPNMNSNFSSCGENQNASFCLHFVQAIDLSEIKKTIDSGFYTECPQCKTTPNGTIEDVDDYYGLSLWLCLRCGNQGCGRGNRKHALQHYNKDHHSLCVNTTFWDVWCYDCRSMINLSFNQKLLKTVEWLQEQNTTVTKQPPIAIKYHTSFESETDTSVNKDDIDNFTQFISLEMQSIKNKQLLRKLKKQIITLVYNVQEEDENNQK